MDRVIKFNSYQAGDFTSNQNLVDFYIPSGAVYNLKDSYLNFNTKINVVEDADSIANGGEGVYAVNLAWSKVNSGSPLDNAFENVALIKSASMSSATKGRIEDIRRVDILRNNLKSYTTDSRTLECDDYLRASNINTPINESNLGIFREFNKEGIIPSRNLDIIPVSVKLSDIFDFCNTEEYDTSLNKGGQTRIHCELNLNKVLPVQTVELNDTLTTSLKQMKTVTGGTAINSVTSDYKLTSLDQCPFWVGERVNVTTTSSDGGLVVTNQARLINSITWNNDLVGGGDGSLTIGLNASLGDNSGGSCVPVILARNYASATVQLNFAEIVLKEVAQPQGLSEISYSTYSTEETNGNKQTNYQRQFQVEAEAVNVLLMLPCGEDDLNSHNENVTGYRLRLNNEDLTDREVVLDDPLYYDRLGMTLNNMDSALRNALQNSGDVTKRYDNRYVTSTFDLLLISNPLVVTNQEKLLQVNIDASYTGAGVDVGVEQMVLFKELPRMLKY
tara:strand:- start:6453 stop:7961 length:1509 start_codon:yes stop_codon:yes gene_type:complete